VIPGDAVREGDTFAGRRRKRDASARKRARPAKRDAFSGCHPIVGFYYFAAAIVFSMVFLHPVLMPLSLIAAVRYSVYLKGGRAVRFIVFGMAPLLVAAAAFNPLFSHAGMTVLFYMPDGNPFTLESVIYGIAAGCMLVTVIIWFSCYNVVMTSDKFIYLFGKAIPALSLVFSMALRFVPRFKAQARVISNAQRCIGRDVSNGNVIMRAKNGITIISILITWALENAIESADSMRSRGYGLKGRTAFSLFRFEKRDGIVLGVLVACTVLVVCASIAGVTKFTFYPVVSIAPFSPAALLVYVAYAGFLALPMIMNSFEDRKWKSIESRA